MLALLCVYEYSKAPLAHLLLSLSLSLSLSSLPTLLHLTLTLPTLKLLVSCINYSRTFGAISYLGCEDNLTRRMSALHHWISATTKHRRQQPDRINSLKANYNWSFTQQESLNYAALDNKTSDELQQ